MQVQAKFIKFVGYLHGDHRPVRGLNKYALLGMLRSECGCDTVMAPGKRKQRRSDCYDQEPCLMTYPVVPATL